MIVLISVLLPVSINSSLQLSLCLEDYLRLNNLFIYKLIVKFLFLNAKFWGGFFWEVFEQFLSFF